MLQAPQRNGHGNGGSARLRSRSLAVAPTDGVLNELRELFGSESVRLVKC